MTWGKPNKWLFLWNGQFRFVSDFTCTQTISGACDCIRVKWMTQRNLIGLWKMDGFLAGFLRHRQNLNEIWRWVRPNRFNWIQPGMLGLVDVLSHVEWHVDSLCGCWDMLILTTTAFWQRKWPFGSVEKLPPFSRHDKQLALSQVSIHVVPTVDRLKDALIQVVGRFRGFRWRSNKSFKGHWQTPTA